MTSVHDEDRTVNSTDCVQAAISLNLRSSAQVTIFRLRVEAEVPYNVATRRRSILTPSESLPEFTSCADAFVPLFAAPT